MLTVKIQDTQWRDAVRAHTKKVQAQIVADVVTSLVTDASCGRINAYNFVNDTRPSGLIALYDADGMDGRRVKARQSMTHVLGQCDLAESDDGCPVCDVMYAQEQRGTAGYA
jgi:hypothetical protein